MTENGRTTTDYSFVQYFQCRGCWHRINTDLLPVFLVGLGLDLIQAKELSDEMIEKLNKSYAEIIRLLEGYDWQRYDSVEQSYAHARQGFDANATEVARVALAKLQDGFFQIVNKPSREIDEYIMTVLKDLGSKFRLITDYRVSEYGIGKDDRDQWCYYHKTMLNLNKP